MLAPRGAHPIEEVTIGNRYPGLRQGHAPQVKLSVHPASVTGSHWLGYPAIFLPFINVEPREFARAKHEFAQRPRHGGVPTRRNQGRIPTLLRPQRKKTPGHAGGLSPEGACRDPTRHRGARLRLQRAVYEQAQSSHAVNDRKPTPRSRPPAGPDRRSPAHDRPIRRAGGHHSNRTSDRPHPRQQEPARPSRAA